MKYLKSYELIKESTNPDRISDGTFRIYSNRLFPKNGLVDRKDQNLFYISDISTGDSFDHYDFGLHICIKFYNSNFTIFGSKILSVGIIVENGNLISFFGEVGSDRLSKPQIIDVMFSEDSFKDLIEFIREDFPEYYNILERITFSELKECHRKISKII